MDKKITCNNCGASDFTYATQNGKKIRVCNYCKTEYVVVDNLEVNPEKLSNANVSGIGQTGVYVVYHKLTVSGMNNIIRLLKSAPDSATSAAKVRKLTVSGMNNTIEVMLMPNATKTVSGVNNIIRNK